MNDLYLKYVERFENLEWLKEHLCDQSIEELFSLYVTCIQNGLFDSSILVLREMCKSAQNPANKNMVIDLLNSEIFMHNDLGQVTKYFFDIIQPFLQEKFKKNSILFHLYGWLYGGAERAISKVVNAISDEFFVMLVVFSPVKNTEYRLNSNIKFMEIKGEVNKVIRLYKLVCLLHPNIFVGNNNSIPEFLPIYEWLYEKSIKTIAYCHEYYFYMYKNNFLCNSASLKNHFLKKASAVIFLTDFSVNVYSLINDNGAKIPNALSFENSRNKVPSKNPYRLIAVGRYFDLIKRVDLLLEVFAEILKKFPSAVLTIVGEYNMDLLIPERNCTVKELLELLKLDSETVNFVGRQANVESFYQEADVLLLTSDNEGFPMVLVEAGMYGVPAVIVDIPGLDEIIIDGKNGYVVPRDIKIMANKVVTLLSNNKLFQQMSQTAQNYSRRYSITNIKQQWISLLTQILTEDSQEQINEFLKSNYRKDIEDMEKFSRVVLSEYEASLDQILNSQTF